MLWRGSRVHFSDLSASNESASIFMHDISQKQTLLCTFQRPLSNVPFLPMFMASHETGSTRAAQSDPLGSLVETAPIIRLLQPPSGQGT